MIAFRPRLPGSDSGLPRSDTIDQLTAAAGLVALARARWPEDGDGTPPPLAGFIVSQFSPLIAAVAGRCLQRHPDALISPERGERTAVIIASSAGDVDTAVSVAGAVDAGTRLGPLLFFQAVPNAVAGHVAARWGLGGPVVCLSPAGDDELAEGLALAALLIRDGDADDALIIVDRRAEPDDAAGHAIAVLVGAGGAGRHGETAGCSEAKTETEE